MRRIGLRHYYRTRSVGNGAFERGVENVDAGRDGRIIDRSLADIFQVALHTGLSVLSEVDKRVSCRTENIRPKLPFFRVAGDFNLILSSSGLALGLQSLFPRFDCLFLRFGQSVKTSYIGASRDDCGGNCDSESYNPERNIGAGGPCLRPRGLDLFSPIIAFVGLIVCVGRIPMFVRWDPPFLVIPSIVSIVIAGGIFTAWLIV